MRFLPKIILIAFGVGLVAVATVVFLVNNHVGSNNLEIEGIANVDQSGLKVQLDSESILNSQSAESDINQPDRVTDLVPTEEAAQTITPEVPMSPVSSSAYNGPIEHIFFHPLVSYPERAFDGDRISQGFDDWFVTVSEFKKIIQSIYDHGYILVGVNDAYEKYLDGTNGTLRRKTLYLPSGKKPLILSIDDLNYYPYMQVNGTSDKLVIDDAGNIATLSRDASQQMMVSEDNEIIPIINSFVQSHPDFSFNNAKGVIALTGFSGVLGYRTQAESLSREAETKAVAPIIDKLKQTGWTFASHGYAHLDARKISAQTLAQDTKRWLDEVKPLVGETYVYIYPFGAQIDGDAIKLSVFENSGFSLLLGVGPKPYEKKLGNSIFALRRHIDGIALRQLRNLNLSLFDANEVINIGERGVSAH